MGRIGAVIGAGLVLVGLVLAPASAAAPRTCEPGPGAACARVELDGAKLAGRDLSRANLARASLVGADLTRAKLPGANLTRADLTRARLKRADLTRANLTRATLQRAVLRGADLRGARLTRARLRNADLRGARLGAVGAKPPTAGTARHLLVDPGTCTGREPTCMGDFSYADLRGSKLAGAWLLGAILYGADLRGATLQNTLIYSVSLVQANLSGADLSGTSIGEVDAQGANLEGATLTGVKLSAVDLRGASLVGVDLRGVSFHDVDLRGANLNGANLAGVDLTNAFVDAAALAGANTEGAILPPGFLAASLRLTVSAGQQFSATVTGARPTTECALDTSCSAEIEFGAAATLVVRTSWAGFAICPDGPVRLTRPDGSSTYTATCTFTPSQSTTIALRPAHWVVVRAGLGAGAMSIPRVSIEWRAPPTYDLVEPAHACESASECVAYYPEGASVQVVTTGTEPYSTVDDGTCTGGSSVLGLMFADTAPFRLTCLVDAGGVPRPLEGDREIVLTVS